MNLFSKFTKKPSTHLRILQDEKGTMIFLDGNLIKGKDLLIDLWVSDEKLAHIAKENKPEIPDWGWYD